MYTYIIIRIVYVQLYVHTCVVTLLRTMSSATMLYVLYIHMYIYIDLYLKYGGIEHQFLWGTFLDILRDFLL
jgi:hypothetical protein